jgi:hypothetical protein
MVKVEEEIADVSAAVKSEDAEERGGENVGQASEEADLLENALDTIQDTAEGERKTREEAEADKRKLLEGELLDEGPYESEGEEEYTGDYRNSVVPRAKKEEKTVRNKYCLPVPEEDAEMLRKLGVNIVSDDEAQIVGGNMIPPWSLKKKDDKTADDKAPSGPRLSKRSRIIFKEKFDIVELDANGHVIDKGDENFTPSNKWIGRKPGFEFKLGVRGLGYYRTPIKYTT